MQASITCGELFLVWCVRVTQTSTPIAVSSDARHSWESDGWQLLDTTAEPRVTKFRSIPHSRGHSDSGFETGESAVN